MPTSVRLDPRTETVLRRIVRRTGRTRSEVIREAIHRLVDQNGPARGATVYARIKDLLGVARGGPADLGLRSEEYLRGMFARRRNRP